MDGFCPNRLAWTLCGVPPPVWTLFGFLHPLPPKLEPYGAFLPPQFEPYPMGCFCTLPSLNPMGVYASPPQFEPYGGFCTPSPQAWTLWGVSAPPPPLRMRGWMNEPIWPVVETFLEFFCRDNMATQTRDQCQLSHLVRPIISQDQEEGEGEGKGRGWLLILNDVTIQYMSLLFTF